MATDVEHRQALELVRCLTADSDVTPQQVLLQKSSSTSTTDIRGEAAYLLKVAGGWTYREIADVFEAFAGHTSAREAVRRANVDDDRVVEARRVLWRNV